MPRPEKKGQMVFLLKKGEEMIERVKKGEGGLTFEGARERGLCCFPIREARQTKGVRIHQEKQTSTLIF